MSGQALKMRASRDMAKKLRWFDKGAEAFQRTFPDALAFLGGNPPPHYVCPECAEPDESGRTYRIRLLPRLALASGDLTAEHVPPKSFGGRPLVLTCKSCNDFAGHQLDAHARKRENPGDALLGATRKPSRVAVTMGEHTVAASLEVDQGMLDLTIPPLRKNANDPRALPPFWEALRHSAAGQPTLHLAFSGDLHEPRRARVSWLRHAYLALFAVAGYRYIFQPGLGIVRRQIKEPDVEHIPLFLAALPEHRPWTEKCIIHVHEPEWLRCWAVQFGSYLVFLPRPGDGEFYSRIAQQARLSGHGTDFSGDLVDWPTEPLFGLDMPQGAAARPLPGR